jgi:hypothetical protein
MPLRRTALPTATHALCALGIGLGMLTGCGDSLLSGAALEEALGVDRLPESAGWMRAWVEEGGEGVLLSCELEEIEELDIDEDDDDVVYFGRAEVPAPEVAEPLAWTETDDYEWGLALFVLVDLDRVIVEEVVEVLEEGEELFETTGLWGIANEHVRLHGDGDMDALGDELVAGQVPPELDDGQAWMGFAPRIVDATGTFVGALTALEPEDQEDVWEEGLTVRHLDTLDDATLRLLSGEPFGGVGLADDCDEERR